MAELAAAMSPLAVETRVSGCELNAAGDNREYHHQPVNPTEWRRIKAVFADAWEQPASGRSAFVAAACGADAWLREEVEKLLRSYDVAADLYETPVLSAPALASVIEVTGRPWLVGTSIGPYRIVRELGEGGMGRVYLAERIEGEFDQQVAIKFVSGLPTDTLLERFREERRILATLDHPHIARLIDGGTTDDGHPYVMMEYVAGVPIDEFADARGLGIKARVELFLEVCSAVQYAHQRLVIHRDLKARNILVTADGTPKLLDFGIAKLLDPGLMAAEQTRTMFRVMTPETASPEQMRGEPVTTASDVYALGLLLYRLLTRENPYRLEPHDDAALMRAVCELDPVPPSRRMAIAGPIDRDLDLVVLKALRKEPERRYVTASQLSDDLRRYLEGRPVDAAPDGGAYRLRKFAGRHRLGVAAAAAIAVAVAGGTLATVRQSQIANRERARAQGRFDDVRQLANAFLFDVHDAIQNLPGSTPARRLLITKVLDYLEKLSGDVQAESRLQLEIATAYQRVGSVQGNPYHANIGDTAGATESYHKALDISERLVGRDPSVSHRAALAASHHLVADMLWAKGSFTDALEHYRVAVALRDRLAVEEPSENRQLDLALSHYCVGQTLLRMGDHAGAAEAYTRSQAIHAQILETNPSNALARRSLGTSAAKLGDVLAVHGDHRRALDYHVKAVSILRDAAIADPINVSNRRSLSLLLYRVSVDRKELGDRNGALAAGREALDLQNAILEADPTNVQARADAAMTHRVLGETLAASEQWREAQLELSTAERILRAALGTNRDNADNATALAMILMARGDGLVREGGVSQAREVYAEAVTLFEAHASREETSRYRGLVHEHAGDLEQQLARVTPARGEHLRDACRHYRLGLDALQRRAASGDPRDVAQVKALSDKLAGCSIPSAALRPD